MDLRERCAFGRGVPMGAIDLRERSPLSLRVLRHQPLLLHHLRRGNRHLGGGVAGGAAEDGEVEDAQGTGLGPVEHGEADVAAFDGGNLIEKDVPGHLVGRLVQRGAPVFSVHGHFDPVLVDGRCAGRAGEAAPGAAAEQQAGAVDLEGLHAVAVHGGGEADGEDRVRVVLGRLPPRRGAVVQRIFRASAGLGARGDPGLAREALARAHGGLADGHDDGPGIALRGILHHPRRPLRRVGDIAGEVAFFIDQDPVHADAPAAAAEHHRVELPDVAVGARDHAAVGRTGHDAVRAAEEGIVRGVLVRALDLLGLVVTLGIGPPLRARGRILQVVCPFILVDPRPLDPGDVRELVLLALALPHMGGIETEMVRDGAHEPGDVVRVQLDGIDAADGHARPEQVGLVLLVHVDVRVEALAPAVLAVRRPLPLAQDLIRPERVVGHPHVGTVAGHVELAVVGAHIRRDRHPGHIVVLPVEHVGGHPCAASGAEHIVLAFPLEDAHVSRGASLADLHRQRVAVTRIPAQRLGLHQSGGKQRRDYPNDPFLHDYQCCG